MLEGAAADEAGVVTDTTVVMVVGVRTGTVGPVGAAEVGAAVGEAGPAAPQLVVTALVASAAQAE